jgi:pimeloyl-ACP methyl ester carboxylesterase
MPGDRAQFIRTGHGPPLVLIHGLGHRWQAWEPVIDQLSAVHDVLALDVPGFGASPVPPGGMPADMAAMTAVVSDVIASAGIDRPHVAGNSFGGSIALELAAAGLAASATAFAPAGFSTSVQRRKTLAILWTLRGATFLPEPVIRLLLRSPSMRALCFGLLVTHPRRLSAEQAIGDALAMRRGRGFRGGARATRGYRFTGQPTVPVTIAWGKHDRILPPRQAADARARLPRAHHVWLPSCGHVPMHDDPHLVASTILATTAAVDQQDG